MKMQTKKGIVYLGGVGWGLPELFPDILREALQRADAIFYVPELTPFLPEIVPPRFFTGNVILCPPLDPDQGPSPEWKNLVQRIRSGQNVVRLYAEDPLTAAGGNEEIRWLVRQKLPFQILPGPSTLAVACALLQIPADYFGNPEHAATLVPQVKMVPVFDEDWWSILPEETEDEAETYTILIGRTKTGAIRIRRGKWKELQRIDLFREWDPPALLFFVTRKRSPLRKPTWLEQLPLYGQRIVVTRARHQALPFIRQLRQLGADVLYIPTIRIERTSRMDILDEAISGLNAYDWVIFTSANGVDAFFERFFERFEDMRDFGGARIAAVGPATAARLRELRLTVDLIPKTTTAEGIAKELGQFMSIENLRVLLLRAENATSDLPKILEDKGAIVDDIPCYRTVPEIAEETLATRTLREEGADWLTFFSGSSVEYFHERFSLPSLLERFPKMKIAVLGPQATHALQKLGITPTVEAVPHTLDALLLAIQQAVQQERSSSKKKKSANRESPQDKAQGDLFSSLF